MPEIVYVLCALTSFACAVLQLRGWLRSRVRLLLSSALCFFGFALNNGLLLVDLYIGSLADLSVLRAAVALVGIAALLFGLIWDSK